MKAATVYPLQFIPVSKTAIWGGHRIAKLFNRPDSREPCAESWEISDRPEGMSVVRNGPLAGKSLHELSHDWGRDLLGNLQTHYARFPLLVKILDATHRLSVQVHPDDRAADIYGGEAKSEMWYVLAAEPGASVFAGLKAGTTLQRFEAALAKGDVGQILNRVPVQPGVAVYVPGGMVHAIDEGCVLLEVQQNSNTTYRVHDWNRVDEDGQPRELHLEQARNVINWKMPPAEPVKPQKWRESDDNAFFKVIESPYFRVMVCELKRAETVPNDGRSFHVAFSARGHVRIEGGNRSDVAVPGTTSLLPAALSQYTLTPEEGPATVVLISLV